MFLMTRMFFVLVSRLLVLPRPHSLLAISRIACSTSVVSDQNVRNGFTASRTSQQSCSSLQFPNTTNYFSKTRQWIACRRLLRFLTPSVTRDGLSKHQSFFSWTRSIVSRKNFQWAQWRITSRITRVSLVQKASVPKCLQFAGEADYAAACDYILNRFVSLNQHETKQIYTHFTCATDTMQIRFVMAAVNGMIVKY